MLAKSCKSYPHLVSNLTHIYKVVIIYKVVLEDMYSIHFCSRKMVGSLTWLCLSKIVFAESWKLELKLHKMRSLVQALSVKKIFILSKENTTKQGRVKLCSMWMSLLCKQEIGFLYGSCWFWLWVASFFSLYSLLKLKY